MARQVRADRDRIQCIREPTYTEAAVTVLRELRAPAHVRELIRRFHAKGWFTDRDVDDAKFRNSVLGSLARDVRSEDGTLMSAGRGKYTLRAPKEAHGQNELPIE